MTDTAFAFALGIGTRNRDNRWLEVFFPRPLLHPPAELAGAVGDTDNDTPLTRERLGTLQQALAAAGAAEEAELAGALQQSEAPVVAVLLAQDTAPGTVPEAYLKLHLLSHRLVKPHQVNLEGLFGTLPNVAWTSEGAVDLAELPHRRLEARLQGRTLQVDCVDKFPKMTDYLVPAGVRIADTARVRLGAYVGEGTTVMHEGFINFNAGTEGPGMIEGRISAGVLVGSGSDLGGGSSTMGTLSGGGNIVISVGQNCLLGANAGTGIPLGDRCTIEAGLYITAGTPVTLLDNDRRRIETIKARELAGRSDLLFRRNAATGTVECLTNRSAVELNRELHAHN